MGQRFAPEAYVRQARALQRRKDQQATLRQITQPAAIICGRFNGQYALKRQEFMAEMIPHGSLEVIEQAGYLSCLEAPDAVNDALRDWMRAPLVLR